MKRSGGAAGIGFDADVADLVPAGRRAMAAAKRGCTVT